MTNVQIVASKWSGDLPNGCSNSVSDWLTVPGSNERGQIYDQCLLKWNDCRLNFNFLVKANSELVRTEQRPVVELEPNNYFCPALCTNLGVPSKYQHSL